jgi:lipid-binding SYLF domain-containing protein
LENNAMSRWIAPLMLAGCLMVEGSAVAQLPVSREDQTATVATAVLNEIMAVPVTRIPEFMLADAQGVAIVPNVLKGGFVVGVRHGRGVVLVRDPHGNWQPPQFVSLTGGSVGWQAGVQATDVILVFKTANSVQNLMRGKFTLGVDAAAAAGPVGREAAAATDAALKAEIYSYSRSRGLFAGVSLAGSALQIDHAANQAYYRAVAPAPGMAPVPQIPASALKLMATLSQYTRTPQPLAGPVPAGALQPAPIDDAAPEPAVKTPPPTETSADANKQQLALAAGQLSAILDDSWRRHLALPAEVYAPMSHPNLELLAATVARFDRVASDPRYRALSERAEFRRTHELLLRYQQSLMPGPAPVPVLPPPPME